MCFTKPGIDFPSRLQVDVGWVLQKLMSAESVHQDSGAHVMMLDPQQPRYTFQREVLLIAQQRSLVARMGGRDSNMWSLTKEGKMNLRVHMKLCKPRLALEPRPGIAIENMNSFELWLAMSEQGWVCHEYSIEVRKRHKDTAQILREGAVQPVPTYEPYKEGSAKIWWTKPTQKVVFPEYLLCLLQVDKHGKDVTHFQTKGFYRAMLDGKEYTPKARRQGFEFSDKKKVARGKPTRAQQKKSEADPTTKPTPTKDPSEDEASDAQPTKDPSEDEASDDQEMVSAGQTSDDRADSDQNTYDSFSDESKRSSSGSDDAPRTLVPAVPGSSMPAALGAPVLAGPAVVASGVASIFDGLPDGETSVMWRGFKFCRVKRKEVVVGYECVCYITEHKETILKQGGACTRARNFEKHGGKDNCERILKYWARTFCRSADFCGPPSRPGHCHD